MLTGAKALAIYVVPKIEVQVSGSFRSTPGTALTAGFTATNAYLAANSTLGRPLSGAAQNVVVGIEELNQMYTERRQEPGAGAELIAGSAIPWMSSAGGVQARLIA